jgi:hypothetical protein
MPGGGKRKHVDGFAGEFQEEINGGEYPIAVQEAKGD